MNPLPTVEFPIFLEGSLEQPKQEYIVRNRFMRLGAVILE